MSRNRIDAPKRLRAVADENPPLDRDAMQSFGNQRLIDARNAALDAMHISTGLAVYRRNIYTPSEVRALHRSAKAAVAAWVQVEVALAEIVHEYDKARAKP